MAPRPVYRIEFSPRALKALGKLPREARAAIGEKIDALANDPRPHGYIKMAGPDDLYRIRAGNYRVVYSIEDAALVVEVVRVG